MPYSWRVPFYAFGAIKVVTSQNLGSLGPVEVLIYNVRGGMNAKRPLEMTYEEMRDIFEIECVATIVREMPV